MRRRSPLAAAILRKESYHPESPVTLRGDVLRPVPIVEPWADIASPAASLPLGWSS